jgi:hypothetical protein
MVKRPVFTTHPTNLSLAKREAIMKSLYRRLGFVVLSLGMATGLGCGKPEPKLVPVSGTLVNGNKPIPSVTVLFACDLSTGGQNFDAYASTDEQGKFTLFTGQHGQGAVAGHYKVSVTSEGPHRLIPTKFTQFGTTTLHVDIPEGGTTDLKLDLGK